MEILSSLGDHAGFIVAAYLVTFVAIGALIVWIRIDGAAQKRALDALQRRGFRRRADIGVDVDIDADDEETAP
ncbi:MAG: heme exporter protein CcmD [Rhodobiaceae bacterium]|nr:heme exporter protein CcmD [Rhodobiaceae bacterium]MCC0041272.1 heme exporter protein CcmD [Rhodobiaceae bacterium]